MGLLTTSCNSMSMVAVKPSAIPGAGKGVFTKQHLPKGTACCLYVGKKWLEADKDSDYVLHLSDRRACDAVHVVTCPPLLVGHEWRKFGTNFGRYINDVYGPNRKNKTLRKHLLNCAFDLSTIYGPFRDEKGTVYYACNIRTTRNIKAGQELLIDYDDEYWI